MNFKKISAICSFVVIATGYALTAQPKSNGAKENGLHFFKANHPYIQYTGRIDFSNPLLPRFWAPGVYIKAKFRGTLCEIILND